MRNKVWKSFRYKILCYSAVSLVLSFVTVVLATVILVMGSRLFVGETVDNSQLKEVAKTESYEEKRELTVIGEKEELENVPDGWMASIRNNNHFFRNPVALFFMILFLVIVAIVSFVLYFHLLTKKMADYLEEVSSGIDEIATGDFHKEISVRGEDEFANIAEKLNVMTREIRLLIESERNYEKEKDALITNVAHDLRTPLTSVIGYLDLVRKKNEWKDEERNRYISIAYDKAKRLEKLIEDLFEFTKVGAERMQVHPAQIDFRRFMEQMVEEFYPSFEAADLKCEFQMEMEDGMIQADGNLLARGIANLFSNAVKYGRDGKIIKVKVKEDKESQCVKLEIINFGEIISPDDLNHIFDKFFRGESSRSTETGGSGLGLAIAKKVVLLHHGQISVSSDYKGTIFSIKLPMVYEMVQDKEDIS